MSIVLPNNILAQFDEISPAYNMISDGIGKYWFHHRPSFLNQNPSLYKNIISSARSSIAIWDPYFHVTNRNDSDHLIFDSINPNITIRILTSIGLTQTRANYLIDVYNAVKTLIPSSKNINFCIGVINTFINTNWKFHDRYLIIDGTQVYLIGASVQYNHTSIESSGIYKVSNTETIDFINNQFELYWAETEKQPSGVEFLHS